MLGINYEARSFALTDRTLIAVGAYEIGTFNMQIFLMIFYPSADPKQISVHILNCNFHFAKNKSCDYHLSGVKHNTIVRLHVRLVFIQVDQLRSLIFITFLIFVFII